MPQHDAHRLGSAATRRFAWLLPVVTSLVIGGCSGSREPKSGVFNFELEGVRYQILSIVDASRNGSNLLVCRGVDRGAFRASDGDQDGVIEVVLTGNITVEEANRIYGAGLDIARAGGKVENREAQLLFTVEERERMYSIRSIVDGPGSPLNTFTVYDSEGLVLASVVDDDADGSLDRIIDGSESVTSLQPLYLRVINQGLLLGRIGRSDDHYFVLLGPSR